MYCSDCGTQVADDTRFCPNCGKGMNGQYRADKPYGGSRIVYTEKSVGLAVVLSLLISGAGQMYVGKIGRGIAMLLLSFLVYGLMFTLMMAVAAAGGGGSGMLIVLLLMPIALIGLYIYIVYDAYILAKSYNQQLRERGQPPW